MNSHPRLKRVFWPLVSALLAALIIFVTAPRSHSDNGHVVFTIGPKTAEASSIINYTTTGAHDNLIVQLALNALPASGGELDFLAGTYSFDATVSRPIGNVIIKGMGGGSLFNSTVALPLFSAGAQSGWQFRDLATDANGITVAGATNWTEQNVTIGATYYSYRTSTGILANTFTSTVGGGTAPFTVTSTTKVTNLNADLIDGYNALRTADAVIAGSDAPAAIIAQSTTQLAGVNDQVAIAAAINGLPATNGRAVLFGTAHIGGTIAITRGNFELYVAGTIYRDNNANADMMTIIPGGGTISDVRIWGPGTVDGNGANQGNGFWAGIVTTSLINFRVGPGLNIKNTMKDTANGGEAVKSTNKASYSSGNLIDGVYFENVYYASYGIDIANSTVNGAYIGGYLCSITNSEILDIQHDGGYLANSRSWNRVRMTAHAGATVAGVTLEYGTTLTDVNIDNFEIDMTGALAGATIGIGLTPNANNSDLKNIHISNGTIRAATKGISIKAFGGLIGLVEMRDINIDNVYFDTSGTYDIEIDTASSMTPSNIYIGSGVRSSNGSLLILPKGDNITMATDPSRFVNLAYYLNSNLGSSSTANGGTVTGTQNLLVGSGGGANGTAIWYEPLKIDKNDYTANFDKMYIVDVRAYRTTSDAGTTAYIKIDDGADVADPGSKAFGFKFSNLAVYGQAYDNALDTVDLSYSVVSSEVHDFRAWDVPTIGVFFFIDGTYKGMSTREPSGTLVNAEELVLSLICTNATDVRLYGNYATISRYK